jgi:hypothetical protein
MKKTFLMLTAVLGLTVAHGQTQTSKTTTPKTQPQQQLKPGSKVKLGIGTSDNGNFKFIYTNSNQLLNLQKINLDGSFSNLSVQILGVDKVGNERLGYKTMLTVWIDDDSVPTSAIKAYALFCVKADEMVAEQQKELEEKKTEFTYNKSNYTDLIKSTKQKEIEDMEKRIADEKADVEKEKATLMKEVSTMRWIVDYDSALASGEIKK